MAKEDFKDYPALYPIMAQHYQRAGEFAMAAEHLRRTGDINMQAYNNAEAITAYKTALSLEVQTSERSFALSRVPRTCHGWREKLSAHLRNARARRSLAVSSPWVRGHFYFWLCRQVVSAYASLFFH